MAKKTKVNKKKSRFSMTWHQLKKNKVAMVSLVVLVIIVLVAILAPVIAPYGYEVTDKRHTLEGPSSEHLLGTDRLGRDVLSRLIWGARQSIAMGVLAISISAVLGIIIGAIAGYFGGWLDNLLMRFLDIYQSIPMMLLCITFAAILGPSLRNAIIAIGISMVPGFARMMRAQILTVRERVYRGGQMLQRQQYINTHTPHNSKRHISPYRKYNHEHRRRGDVRCGPQLYRSWRPVSNAGVGRNDIRREKFPPSKRRTGAVPGPLHYDYRFGI